MGFYAITVYVLNDERLYEQADAKGGKGEVGSVELEGVQKRKIK